MKYLLDAEDAKMLAWKDQAKREGLPFAEWLRRAADRQLGVVEPPRVGRALEARSAMAKRREKEPAAFQQPAFVPVAPQNAQGSLVRGGKRSYEPDPR